MTIALAQENHSAASGAGGYGLTFANPPVVGNTILVAIAAWAGAANGVSLTSVVDDNTVSNTYTQDKTYLEPTANLLRLYAYRAQVVNTKSLFKITATFASAVSILWSILEYSGLDGNAPAGTSQGNVDRATNSINVSPVGSVQAANSGMILGVMSWDGGDATSLNTPGSYTSRNKNLTQTTQAGDITDRLNYAIADLPNWTGALSLAATSHQICMTLAYNAAPSHPAINRFAYIPGCRSYTHHPRFLNY
jgi:hypothetical protein